jgi:SAM-dependent methyltransferase
LSSLLWLRGWIFSGPAETVLRDVPSGRYGVISLTDALRFFCRPRRSLAAILKALAPGGWVVVREANADRRHAARAVESSPGKLAYCYSLQEWAPAAFRKALLIAGFRNIRIIPAPPFTEVDCIERRICGAVARLAKRAVHVADQCARFFLHRTFGPEFIAIGQR